MKPISDLRRKLISIDGKLYAAYKEIEGEYESATMKLIIDNIQNDPFSTATRIRIRINQKWAKFPERLLEDEDKLLALRDFILRQLSYEAAKFSKTRGTGKSGEIHLPAPSPVILDRSTVLFDKNEKTFEARLFMGLPASGKHITGHIAADILTQEIPRIVEKSMIYQSLNHKALNKHINGHTDANFIRKWLEENNAVAFIGENSVIPRKKGSEEADNHAQPFSAEDESLTTITLPNRGAVKGMVIYEGFTVISGPPSCGKSELLASLQHGIYNHIPGDGRGLVIVRNDATMVKNEPSRAFHKVDMGIFHNSEEKNLSSRDISEREKSKYSQMTNVCELLESGCKTLLLDENSLTPEFLYSPESENEKTFYDIIPRLVGAGVSVILVTRAFPVFNDLASQIVTGGANHIWKTEKKSEINQSDNSSLTIKQRTPNPRTINPRKGNKSVSISSRGAKTLAFGSEEVDLVAMECLVETGQIDAIGQSINYAKKNLMGESYALRNIASRVISDIKSRGWDVIDRRKMGIYGEFRTMDFVMVLNRLKDVEMQ